MDSRAYAALDSIRGEFRGLVGSWLAEHPYLLESEERVRKQQGYDDYGIETPIVYNRALDEIGPEREIRIVLVADNPGKNEQLAANNRYLVGQSGKLAEGWFRRELGMDFRRDVAILNKTPVHTPKTAELSLLSRNAGIHRERVMALLAGSQAAMADLAWRLFVALAHARESVIGSPSSEPRCGSRWPVLWISGLGEMRNGGLFETYRDELARRVAKAPDDLRSRVWAFNHFSMNQFAIELKRKAAPRSPLLAELARIGRENARRVLGL